MRSGPGPDRTRLVPSTGRKSSYRESSWLAGLAVFGQSVKLSVCQSVRVGLLGKTATSRQSAAGRSVGEVRESRAVKRVSNGVSDMMTEAEGVERGRRGG